MSPEEITTEIPRHWSEAFYGVQLFCLFLARWRL